METTPRKSYLPMPLTGARRIENERVVYRDLQRRHHAEHPDYVLYWRRPSDDTAPRVLELIELPDTDLTVEERLDGILPIDGRKAGARESTPHAVRPAPAAEVLAAIQ